MRDKIVEAFASGYMAGHEHTVEGIYCGDELELAGEFYNDNNTPKRTPDSNGVLPMTESDLKGLTKAYRYDFSILKAVSVRLSLTHLELVWDRLPPEVIENVAAILYLDKLFELEEKKYEHL